LTEGKTPLRETKSLAAPRLAGRNLGLGGKKFWRREIGARLGLLRGWWRKNESETGQTKTARAGLGSPAKTWTLERYIRQWELGALGESLARSSGNCTVLTGARFREKSATFLGQKTEWGKEWSRKISNEHGNRRLAA
jgi:hypothetical protein